MNATHIKYDATSGRVESFLTCPENELAWYAAPNFAFLASPTPADPYKQYVPGGVLTPRPANPTTRAGTVLNNVPVPAVVSINGTRFDTADADVDLGLTLPGTYTVTVSAFPYLDATFTIVIP